LLDVIVLSPIIADIIRSVTAPGMALVLVFYLFIITIMVYTSFGMRYFHSEFLVPTNDDAGVQKCRSMLSCSYFLFYKGITSFDISGSLGTPEPGYPAYPMRIVYDSVFGVWVGTVLSNIITGLMVDTFGSLRGDKDDRASCLESECFVCGMSRNTYEDFGLPQSLPNFDEHLASDHNLWIYVYYIAYLKRVDSVEESGIESFVKAKIAEGSLEWIPSRTSVVLEAAGKTGRARDGAGALPDPAAPTDTFGSTDSEISRKLDLLLIKAGNRSGE
jgi:hypothetical protein